MIRFSKNDDLEYTCTLNNNEVVEMIGKNIDEIMNSANTDVLAEHLRLLIEKTVSQLREQYNIDALEHIASITISEGPPSTKHVTMKIRFTPVNFAIDDDDEDFEMDVMDEEESDVYDSEPEMNQDKLQQENFGCAYAVRDIENIILLQQKTHIFDQLEHALFYINKKYVIFVKNVDTLDPQQFADYASMLKEYTQQLVNVTYEYLSEYAKFITASIPEMVRILTKSE